ncbi:MAG TPA: 16S rRNA (adenine(1518)-N(6)/adenine(1519)-N(6))-dimethyltransferase RsmA [Bacteroidia bacterium]
MNYSVSPKKHLGQHFLRDENIARKIASSLQRKNDYRTLIEIGPGTGMLTKYLLEEKALETFVVEVDRESVAYLKKTFATLGGKIIEKDFLDFEPSWLPEAISSLPFAVIGNFPYNISTQILFKVLEYRNQIPQLVGMFQKEVAERIASPPGNKTYGILSVLLQAFYKIEYLFTVHENVFFPPPKVKSAVIRLARNKTKYLNCNEELFFQVVKTAFNQRRKTLRNSLNSKYQVSAMKDQEKILSKRAEQLSVNDFVELTRSIEEYINQK